MTNRKDVKGDFIAGEFNLIIIDLDSRKVNWSIIISYIVFGSTGFQSPIYRGLIAWLERCFMQKAEAEMNRRQLAALILPFFFLILVSCSLPTRTPSAPLSSLTPTLTPTNPSGLASQTPSLKIGLSTPNTNSPTETQNPTVTPAGSSQSLQPGTYSLFLIYSKDTKDDKFDYFESMNITGTFTLAEDGSQVGKGNGIYSQGLTSLNPAFNCGLPVTAQVSMDIKGTAAIGSTPLLFHQNIVVTFQPLISTTIKCSAAGMTVSMPLSGTTDVLNERAATFPWSDYQINPVLGLYSTLIDGEGIDWKKTGGGELTIAIRRQK